MKTFLATVAVVAGLVWSTGALAQSSTTGTTPPSPSTPPSSSSQYGQPGASSSSASQAGPSAQGVTVDASSIIGAPVRSPQGKDIGKVERLMVDPKDGRIRTVVVQMGGTLGIGGKSVSMPWESVKLAQDGDTIVVSAEQQMLEQAPAASPRTDSKSDSSNGKSPNDDSKKK
jgi:sporulation protein YlmC with PRC-barrel domain